MTLHYWSLVCEIFRCKVATVDFAFKVIASLHVTLAEQMQVFRRQTVEKCNGLVGEPWYLTHECVFPIQDCNGLIMNLPIDKKQWQYGVLGKIADFEYFLVGRNGTPQRSASAVTEVADEVVAINVQPQFQWKPQNGRWRLRLRHGDLGLIKGWGVRTKKGNTNIGITVAAGKTSQQGKSK